MTSVLQHEQKDKWQTQQLNAEMALYYSDRRQFWILELNIDREEQKADLQDRVLYYECRNLCGVRIW